ncbi:MAG: hypothetical protein KJO95_10740 [Gammaproteobacteria bacterium]|nr:hypothetical protein [Gammaproteobacteria bacterium]MBU2678441.1 hypothetical protein [Gammaproteobacteria bacterium]NNL52176.1 hypothetical protein [Woeseiaceae bacterium]
MKTNYLIIALLLALALPAAADFRTIQQAYEIELVNIRLPQADGGTVSFKSCDACAYQTARVSSDMRWILNGQNMTLSKFQEGIDNIEDREHKYVTVVHHLEHDRITEVALTIR